MKDERESVAAMLRPPTPFHLRAMGMADIEAVMAVDRVSFPTPAKARLFDYELTQNELAHYQILTTQENDSAGKIVGFAGFWMMAGEAHISTIAIAPSWRGRGLGELLLLNMLFMANEQAAQLATLEVRQSNRVAQVLYQKYLFEIVGERRRYYRDTREDALIMTIEPLDAQYYQTLEQKRVTLFARLYSEA